MKILIIDNYDSFTFNLYQLVGEILLEQNFTKPVVEVKRNDKITVEEIFKNDYDRIIISQGPGDPGDEKYFGVCAQVLTKVGKTVPVLGVCLGMQGLAFYYGGMLSRRGDPVHGKTGIISHDGLGVFKNLPKNLAVMRYHSLVVDKTKIPDCLEITAAIVDDEESSRDIMGLRHNVYPIEGVQFHPESFATEAGKQMLENFIKNDI